MDKGNGQLDLGGAELANSRTVEYSAAMVRATLSTPEILNDMHNALADIAVSQNVMARIMVLRARSEGLVAIDEMNEVFEEPEQEDEGVDKE